MWSHGLCKGIAISPHGQVDNNNSACVIDLCCSVCLSSGPSYVACYSSLGSRPRAFTAGGTYVCLLYDIGARCSGDHSKICRCTGTRTYGVPYVNCTYEQRQRTVISLGKSTTTTTTTHIHIQLHTVMCDMPFLAIQDLPPRLPALIHTFSSYVPHEYMSAVGRCSGDLFRNIHAAASCANGVPTVRYITSDDR